MSKISAGGREDRDRATTAIKRSEEVIIKEIVRPKSKFSPPPVVEPRYSGDDAPMLLCNNNRLLHKGPVGR